MTTVKKVQVSAEWREEERREISELIKAQIDQLKDEESKMREAIPWEASFLAESKGKRFALNQLDLFVKNAPAAFLEENRRHFNDFVE